MSGVLRRSLLAWPALVATRVRAEDAWPSRPVRIVIPFGAGGPIDNIGRLLAELLRDRLGQPFLIDNRPGAGGSIGIRTVIQSPADIVDRPAGAEGDDDADGAGGPCFLGPCGRGQQRGQGEQRAALHRAQSRQELSVRSSLRSSPGHSSSP